MAEPVINANDPGVAVAPTDTDAHNAAMIAKVDAADAAAKLAAGGVKPEVPAAPVRPDNVPEKFWDAATGKVNTEALLKSYSELEKGRGKVADPAVVETPEARAAADALAVKATADKAAAQSAGVDLPALATEFAENNGSLTEKSYEDLAAKGYDRTLVDGYIAGQLALNQSAEVSALAIVGGKENYGKMIQWAAATLTASEQDAFDKSVMLGGEHTKLAVAGLKSKYESVNGIEPSLIGGKQGGRATQGYTSRAEMTQDMKDPRYAKDPAYRASVLAKLDASPNL